eukprot:5307646-Pleurochrysis_carterae.AAC.1
MGGAVPREVEPAASHRDVAQVRGGAEQAARSRLGAPRPQTAHNPAPVQGWFKRCPRGRTSLIIEFKILVLEETGVLTLPPNCTYDEASVEQIKEAALN